MKGDFTRLTFKKEKHYHDVRRQQGRVDLDADWNEQADITAYRTETEARDVIGLCGAPKHDAGFGVNVVGAPSGNFKIGAGRFYLDGILCENETEILFTKQPDLPGAQPLTTQGRYVLYLDVWQRHLTALDDPEIREVALGGPDTATRSKTIWQVKAIKVGNVGANITCSSQPAPWATSSTGQLSARAQPDAQSDKPCIVPPGAGYRRLENQLYRVEIHGAGDLNGGTPPTFVWSRDNGSIAARIATITNNDITLTTSRKDSALGFAPGQWVEIIDAGQELRGEPGTLVQITGVDDLVLTVDPLSVIGTFPSLPLSSAYLALLPKVRRWDSAGVVTATIPSTNDGFIALEDGVEVKFKSGSYRTGDYWMIPARTDKGTVEWPLDETTSPSVPMPRPAMGIQHHFCRLAIIEVNSAGAVTFKEDCRRFFPPLTELEDCCGCCTKTVGETDAADYRSIQEAIKSLPDSGGQICVLAGTYAESVVISGKRNITIIGCGERSVLFPGSKDGKEIGPIIQIEESSNIRLESLFFVQGLHSAVAVLESSEITICRCEFVMTNPRSAEPAIYFQAEDGLIERNTIRFGEVRNFEGLEERVAATQTAPARPTSGIQLAGGCRRVRVLENLIYRVRGQGITLGNFEVAEKPVGASGAPATGPRHIVKSYILRGWYKNPDDPCDDCGGISTEVRPQSDLPNPKTPTLSAPESLWDIFIERNRIRFAGLDGVGVIGFFDLSKQDEFVTVRRLTILGNEISDCLSSPLKPIAPALFNSMGYGGIALADVSELVIYDNAIQRNGAGLTQPVCGIFVLHGEGIDIQRNRILGNGNWAQDPSPQDAAPPAGRRGGIQIVYALAPEESFSVFNTPANDDFSFRRPLRESTGFPALRVYNNIVIAPVGPALSATALGPVSVVGNQLTTGHVNKTDKFLIFDPATVFISNLGVSNELYSQIYFGVLGSMGSGAVAGLDDSRLGARLANGNILFVDNQISLDLLEPGGSGGILFTSIVLMSLDDIGFLNNQCDCNLGLYEDLIITHAFLHGFSLRVTGNRFKEGAQNAMYSAITVGALNTTAHNQATHCVMVEGWPGLTQDGPNTILFSTACRRDIVDTAAMYAAIRAQSS